MALNEGARKLVARAARAEANSQKASRLITDVTDNMIEDAWRTAVASNPDFRDWPSARRYFEAVFVREVSPDAY